MSTGRHHRRAHGWAAVWRTARAAVRRRRLQTVVIGLVVLLSTTTIVVALTLLDASSAPFDRAFAKQQGAHAIVLYDPAKVGDPQLRGARTGVAGAAGPFGQVRLDRTIEGARGRQVPATVVGRADPSGPVDRVNLWQGRWVTGPGEVVLNETPSGPGVRRGPDGNAVTLGGVRYTVVGRAHSVSETADAWMTPGQVAALRPTSLQMLYRFTGDVSTKDAVAARVAAVTAGLPGGAFLAAQPYQVVQDSVAEDLGAYIPLLATFGILGLIVAIVIVGNVVSGAVVSGFRHIGVLKALGFTSRQVVAVYLIMVSVPAVAGCVLGTLAGAAAAQPLLNEAFQGLGLDIGIGVGPWIWAVGLLGVPALVAGVALVPAMRAHRLSAAEAISAGSAPRTGQGMRIQRRLAGIRLPRPVTLGLGLPFARPGRTAFTVVAVLLGVTTVTFATGLADTLVRLSTLQGEVNGQIGVQPSDGHSRIAAEGQLPPGPPVATTRTDPQVEQLLRGLPGAARVTAIAGLPVTALGHTRPLPVNFLRGDFSSMGYQKQLTAGRWMAGPDETVVPSQLTHERGIQVGDTITLELAGRRKALTVVGQTIDSTPGPEGLYADWRALTDLAPERVIQPFEVYYQVQLVSGGDVAAYVRAVGAADPGIDAWDTSQSSDIAVTVIGFSSVLALLLSTVAALGVFNTVVLNVRERRRDLGMLKSIGMTPRQVVTMVLVSMALLGVVGGLLGIPLGILAHQQVVPAAGDTSNITLPGWALDVWQAPTVALLGLAGVLIALLGALVPARGAARLTIAEVLHNE